MASQKERDTALGIAAGKSMLQAMIDAGYRESYARRHAGHVARRLQDMGLLQTDDDVREIKARVLEILQGKAEAAAHKLASVAIEDGDVVALKAVLDRAAGPVPKRHEVSMEDVGTVASDLLAAAARELDPEAFERLRAVWEQRLAERKRP